MAAPMRVLMCRRVSLFLRYRVSNTADRSSKTFSTSKIFFRPEKFDTEILKILVCPISKEPLRYDADNNELISDAINVAYPIKNGIPNLIPTDGRMLKDGSEKGSHSDEGTPV